MNALSLTAWCAALFASSALFSHDVALRLVLLALGLLCATAAALTHRRELRLLPPIWWPFLLWAAWAAFSLTWSIEPGRSEKEFANEIVYVALALFVGYVGAQAPRAERIVAPIVAAAAALTSAIGTYTFFFTGEPYAEGWHGGPGNLSSAVLMLMPCILVAAWYGRRVSSAWTVRGSLALGLLVLVAAYATHNRTVWVGFAVQVLLLGFLLSLRSPSGNSRRIRVVGSLVAVGVIAGCALVAARVQAEREAADPATALARELRVKIWPEVLEDIAQAPLTGYGFGRGLFRKSLTGDFENPLIWHAHNLFLDVTLQTGLPGLLLFLLLLGTIVREGWRSVRSSEPAVAAASLALLGLVAGMIARNMTDTLLVRQNSLFFWSALGLLLGWMHARARSRSG